MAETPAQRFFNLLAWHVGPTKALEFTDDLRKAEHLPDAVAWLVDTVGTDPVVRALADTVHGPNLVAAMVDEGVLVELDRSGWDPDSQSPSTAAQGRPRGSLPLYRAAEPGETDRG